MLVSRPTAASLVGRNFLQLLKLFRSDSLDGKNVVPPSEQPLASARAGESFSKYRTNAGKELERVDRGGGEESERILAVRERDGRTNRTGGADRAGRRRGCNRGAGMLHVGNLGVPRGGSTGGDGAAVTAVSP
jgi:hypothetical protein